MLLTAVGDAGNAAGGGPLQRLPAACDQVEQGHRAVVGGGGDDRAVGRSADALDRMLVRRVVHLVTALQPQAQLEIAADTGEAARDLAATIGDARMGVVDMAGAAEIVDTVQRGIGRGTNAEQVAVVGGNAFDGVFVHGDRGH
ncbi:hypothetical protein D9M71_758450 [compost metagenome]